ncbi:MAG: aldehyde dehydrogenase family protein, partial [Actinomycetota bacterium]|nr:aldehyde dehydrogenase family protein [Actinomycetota bacterium]
CVSGKRVLVQRGIHAEFREKLVAKVNSLRLGDPLTAETLLRKKALGAAPEGTAPSEVFVRRTKGSQTLRSPYPPCRRRLPASPVQARACPPLQPRW